MPTVFSPDSGRSALLSRRVLSSHEIAAPPGHPRAVPVRVDRFGHVLVGLWPDAPARFATSVSPSEGFRVADDVAPFVEAHPEIEEWLPEIRAQIGRYFPGAALRLSLDHPREVGDRTLLRVTYSTTLGARDAREPYELMLREWMAGLSHAQRQLLNIHLEFAPQNPS